MCIDFVICDPDQLRTVVHSRQYLMSQINNLVLFLLLLKLKIPTVSYIEC